MIYRVCVHISPATADQQGLEEHICAQSPNPVLSWAKCGAARRRSRTGPLPQALFPQTLALT